MLSVNSINNTEKIIKKFLNLIDKGCSVEPFFKRLSSYRNELTPFIEALKQIKQLKSISPDEDFSKIALNKIYENSKKQYRKNSIRNNLITPRRAVLKPAIVFLSVFLFLAFSFVGTAYASEKSLPGQTIYNVKKSFEAVELAFTPYSKQGTVHLKFLNKRLAEADTIFNNNIKISYEAINKLLEDIDYEYNKCSKHQILSENESEVINKKISNIKMKFQKRYRKHGNIESNIEIRSSITNTTEITGNNSNIYETNGSDNTNENAMDNGCGSMNNNGNQNYGNYNYQKGKR